MEGKRKPEASGGDQVYAKRLSEGVKKNRPPRPPVFFFPPSLNGRVVSGQWLVVSEKWVFFGKNGSKMAKSEG